ncbi:30S ribosomal protein S20 [Candidatus Hepatincolaceae symbiont of Richtersius coronifer]
MANTKSAEKRNRQTIKRTVLNKSRMNMLRTFVKKVEDFIKLGKKEEALSAFNEAQSAIAKTAQKGTLHKNTASRKISRLSSKVKALS